jgi:hypothetical protein
VEGGMMQVTITVETKMDIQGILELYKQPDMDDGKVYLLNRHMLFLIE